MLLAGTFVVQQLGVEPNGLYRAVYGLSTQYLTLVTGAMAAYSFAQLSGVASRPAGDPTAGAGLNAEINNNVRLVALVMIPILAGVVLLRKFGLVVFYSPEFLPAAGLFPGPGARRLLLCAGLGFWPGRPAARPGLGRGCGSTSSSTIVVIPLSWVLLGRTGLSGAVAGVRDQPTRPGWSSAGGILPGTPASGCSPATPGCSLRSLALLVVLALLPSEGLLPYVTRRGC